jgi:hypothetical protein
VFTNTWVACTAVASEMATAASRPNIHLPIKDVLLLLSVSKRPISEISTDLGERECWLIACPEQGEKRLIKRAFNRHWPRGHSNGDKEGGYVSLMRGGTFVCSRKLPFKVFISTASLFLQAASCHDFPTPKVSAPAAISPQTFHIVGSGNQGPPDWGWRDCSII